MTSKNVKRSALILLVGAGLSACSGLGTTVDENDPEAEVPNVSMGRAIMEGLGAVPSRTAPINYSPRAPLVIPKDTASLAQPEDPAKLAEIPNWPVDPDLERMRTVREADEKNRAMDDRGDQIPASQLLERRSAPSTTQRQYQGVPGSDPNAKLASPSLLMNAPAIGGQQKHYDANGTPVRQTLVEPPTTYLEPAPNAPVEIPEEPKKKIGLFSWFD